MLGNRAATCTFFLIILIYNVFLRLKNVIEVYSSKKYKKRRYKSHLRNVGTYLRYTRT